jgi:hypothetical protein
MEVVMVRAPLGVAAQVGQFDRKIEQLRIAGIAGRIVGETFADLSIDPSAATSSGRTLS